MPHPSATRKVSAAGWGFAAGVVLVVAAALVPWLTGWDVVARSAGAGGISVPPLHGTWDPSWRGVGTLPALALGLVGMVHAPRWARTLSWRWLLTAMFVGGLAWMLALATTEGLSGISHVMADPYEYGDTARAMTDVPAALHEWVHRIDPDTPGHWATHVAGHPPLATLFFVALVRIGLGSNLAMGLVVTLVGATAAPAVLATVRRLGEEQVARRAAPFLVLGPAAVYMCVSADAVFTAVAAWGLLSLATAATSQHRVRWVSWSLVAGLLLGACVFLSYGLPLLGLLALAVLWVARSWRPLPLAVVAALAVVAGFALAGFAWWDAYPVLQERYWRGLAKVRPFAYWSWGDLAALVISAGPLLGAGLAVALRRSADRTTRALVGAAAAAIVVADLSRMSKAEVERIWLPFVPWLLLSVALLPPRWRRVGLVVQVVAALALELLIFTEW